MYKYAHVSYISNMWTKYGERRLHGNGKTDLSMKTCIHLTKSLNHENEGNAN